MFISRPVIGVTARAGACHIELTKNKTRLPINRALNKAVCQNLVGSVALYLLDNFKYSWGCRRSRLLIY